MPQRLAYGARRSRCPGSLRKGTLIYFNLFKTISYEYMSMNILPLFSRLDVNEMVIKIFYKLTTPIMPDYLSLFDGHSRLHLTYLDKISFVSTARMCNINKFSSFTATLFGIRCIPEFKIQLTQYFWNQKKKQIKIMMRKNDHFIFTRMIKIINKSLVDCKNC